MKKLKLFLGAGIAAAIMNGSTATSQAQQPQLPPGTIVIPGTGGPMQIVPPRPQQRPMPRVPQQNPNARRRGRRNNSPKALPKTPSPVLIPGGVVSSAPAVGKDGTLYFGSWNDKVYALDPATGKAKWSFTAGKLINASPAVGPDGTVYVGAYDHNVYALDGGTGTKKWQFLTGDVLNTTPAVGPQGLVYVGGKDRFVYAFDPATGKPQWQTKLGAAVSSPVLGTDGTVFVGSDGVYALDGVTGKVKWTLPNGFDPEDPLALGPDGTLYVGTHSGTLYALDPATGHTRWSVPLPGTISYAPVIAGNVVYVGADKLYALRTGDGRILWQFGDGQAVWSTPVVTGSGTVYVGCNSKAVYSLAAGDGSMNWKFTTSDPLLSFPGLSPDGALLVAAEGESKVYALNSRSGRQLWQFQQDAVPSPPPTAKKSK